MMRLSLMLLAAPIAAQDWSFPHQPHLARGLECQSCHPAAQQSSEAADHLLPDRQLCVVCHNGQTAREIDTAPLAAREPATRSYRFDHRFHLGLGNVAPLIAAAIDGGNYFGKPGDARQFLDTDNPCAACHRGLGESLAVDSKLHLPRMGDCIVCHTEIDNPFTCPDCHHADAELLPVDHTREFIELHSTGKIVLDKPSCLPCHGRNFPCMGCH